MCDIYIYIFVCCSLKAMVQHSCAFLVRNSNPAFIYVDIRARPRSAVAYIIRKCIMGFSVDTSLSEQWGGGGGLLCLWGGTDGEMVMNR